MAKSVILLRTTVISSTGWFESATDRFEVGTPPSKGVWAVAADMEVSKWKS